jgi:ferrochelatase
VTAPVAVVLMSYGSPTSIDDIEPYYTDIRRGRPPTAEALADLRARYEAIGGVNALAETTAAQRAALVDALERLDPGRYDVQLGYKHAAPKVATTAERVARAGAETVVGLTLAPHYSRGSIGGYLSALRAGVEAAATSPRLIEIESWATDPAYVEFLAGEVGRRRDALAADGHRVRVVFTAHSLPEKVVSGGDPYPDQLRATADAVATRLGLAEGDDWQLGWQSAGRTDDPWLGPDILETIDDLAEDPDVDAVVVCACGFVADHLEVRYDLDIEASGRAGERGLAFDRTASVADDATVMSSLARTIHEQVRARGGG